MGNSIASALAKGQVCSQLIGIEPKTDFRETAVGSGNYSAVYHSLEEWQESAQSLNADSLHVDILLICTPVDLVADLAIRCHSIFPRTVLSDIASTKSGIVGKIDHELAGQAHLYVGSHPIAGGDVTGPTTGKQVNFQGKRVVITPTEHSSTRAIETMESFWTSIGCQPIQLKAERHDEILAYTSHLPHLISYALSASLAENEAEFCGSGWRDTTRIAKSHPLLWKQILVHNRESLLVSTERFLKVFHELRDQIASSDWDSVIETLEKGKQSRDALGN